MHTYFKTLTNDCPIWRPAEWQGGEKAQQKFADNSLSAEAVLGQFSNVPESENCHGLPFAVFRLGNKTSGRRSINPHCLLLIISSSKKRCTKKKGGKKASYE